MTAAERIVQAFLDELDARIAGKDGGPPEHCQRLAAMQPLIAARMLADPERAAAQLIDEIDAIAVARRRGIARG